MMSCRFCACAGLALCLLLLTAAPLAGCDDDSTTAEAIDLGTGADGGRDAGDPDLGPQDLGRPDPGLPETDAQLDDTGTQRDAGGQEPDLAPDLGPPPEPLAIGVTLDAPVAEVDERFLSVALDTSQLLGGYWWSPGGGMSGGVGTERTDPFDFQRPRLRRLAAELAPAFLRIGGSEADKAYYDLSDDPVVEGPEGFELVLTRERWDALQGFAGDMGFSLAFTLNAGPGPRDEELRWQPDQARQLLTYASGRQPAVDVWELGNEINGFLIMHGFQLDPAIYAQDIAAARALVDELAPGALLAGPSSAYWPVTGEMIGIMDDFMPLGGQHLGVLTWHYYPTQSDRCTLASRRSKAETLLDPAHLDEVARWAEVVEGHGAAHAPQAEIWLGETGNAQCGGQPGVSDTFAGGFWWLDQLGLLARRGQRIVVRQTLAGSEYGLLDDSLEEVRPDYFSSVLHKRLLGTRVLAAEANDETGKLRLYAHCAKGHPGAVVLVAINLDAAWPRELELPEALGAARELWLLTADELTAKTMQLNGTPLAVAEDGTLPDLSGQPAQGPVELPPRSYAFVRLPDADAPACR